MKRGAFDVQHPFFIPLWRRVVFAGFILGWTVVEIIGGNTFWAVLFGAAGVYLVHQFFFAFDPKTGDDTDEKDKT